MFYYFKLFGNDCIINLNELSSFEITTEKDKNHVSLIFSFPHCNELFWSNIEENIIPDLSSILENIKNKQNILNAQPFILLTNDDNIQTFENKESHLIEAVKPLLVASKDILYIYTVPNENKSKIKLNTSKDFNIQETVPNLISTYFFNETILQSKKYLL